jgi:hypothetical protein
VDFLEILIDRNARFAATDFAPDLKIMPRPARSFSAASIRASIRWRCLG